MRAALLIAAVPLLASCGGGQPGRNGLQPGETLLSVGATGQAEYRPDTATFIAGIETIRPSAEAATAANAEAMQKLLAAVEAQGVEEKDVQTANISVNRLDYGPNKGQFSANNQVTVRVRKVDMASAVVGAATGAGANILGGPSLTVADPEAAGLAAHAEAYKAARAKADAYAKAAGQRIVRIIAIRDGSAAPEPPMPYAMAEAAAPTPVSAPPIRTGTGRSAASVTVDFATRGE